MKKFLLLFGMTLIMSCGSLNNICKKAERFNGVLIYAIPKQHNTRNITLEINGKRLKIYGVPVEQDLVNIPACKHNGKYYWVMP